MRRYPYGLEALWPAIAAATALCAAFPWPSYTVLHAMVSTASFASAYVLRRNPLLFAVCLAAGVAFNPVVPFHFGTAARWQTVDLLCAAALIAITLIAWRKRYERATDVRQRANKRLR
jgi:hypothetical protein